jgi:uroporphyrinogen-III synthase
MEELKYFCISESTALYLQKYITFRKRKIFFGKQNITDLIEVLKKHKKEKFIVPCSDIAKQEIADVLQHHGFEFIKAVIYKTVCSDLSDLADVKYDMLVFFSPAGITSLFKNFPDFQQNTTLIAAFGQSTSQAVLEANLRLDIQAPIPEAPSMTMSIEQYLKKNK